MCLPYRNVHFVLVAVLFFSLFPPQKVFASLGDSETTIENDRQSFGGNRKSFLRKNFTVHEITTSNGIAVKEYATANGTIFGVTWQGRVHPDLQVLLGNFHGEFKDHMMKRQKKYGNRHETLNTPNMVVETGGHMGALHGKAFVPSLLPPGVTAEDIQ